MQGYHSPWSTLGAPYMFGLISFSFLWCLPPLPQTHTKDLTYDLGKTNIFLNAFQQKAKNHHLFLFLFFFLLSRLVLAAQSTVPPKHFPNPSTFHLLCHHSIWNYCHLSLKPLSRCLPLWSLSSHLCSLLWTIFPLCISHHKPKYILCQLKIFPDSLAHLG